MTRATILADWTVFRDGQPPVPVPPGWSDRAGVTTVLDRVATDTAGAGGVLVLDAFFATALGLPLASPDAPRDAELAAWLAACGWSAPGGRVTGSWTTVRKSLLPPVNLCVYPWLTSPLALAVHDGAGRVDWQATADGLAMWHNLTGSAYLMSPGVAALQVWRDIQASETDRRFRARMQVDKVCDGYEARDRPATWRSHDGATGPERWSYDARRAGLAAAGVAELARGELKWSKVRQFDRREAGWWLVEVPEWHFDELMPHPIGPVDRPGRGVTRAWVTTPTLSLISDLAETEMIAMPRVLESWTNTGSRVLRGWAERMNSAYLHVADAGTEPQQTVAYTIKQGAAREAIGMLMAGTGAVRRDDWGNTINAQKRVNTWRRAWRVGKQTGLWPLWIDDDSIVYDRQLDDTEMTVCNLVTGNRLGNVRVTRKGDLT